MQRAKARSKDRAPPNLYLKEMSLENFKIHEKTGDIKFKPITLFIGPNSSGKTALIHPILLLKQSFATKIPRIEPVVLNGDFVNLGSFTDIVTGHHTEKTVRIKCVLESKHPNQGEISLDLAISYDTTKKKMFISEVAVKDTKSAIEIRGEGGRTSVLSNGKVLLETPPSRSYSLSALTSISVFGILALIGEGSSSKMPVEVSSDFFKKRKLSKDDIGNILKASAATSLLEHAFTHMKYVGPLREYPQRFYQTSGERFSDVGKKGEKAIEIIYTQGLLGNKAIECKLSDWLKRLGVALTIRFEEIGGGLYSLILVDPVSNTPVNVVDVGFGVSQIIPIIVATCLLEKDQTVIFEQPEIHLHPLGHMIMADLIVDATKHGRRFIIESHSEHLLLRIRRRIAEGKLTPDEVAVYYFEPKEGQIVLRELKIAESGRLADLPPGFMDERLEEAYKIAMAEK